VGAQENPVLIDTNVFVVDLRYKRDVHYRRNQMFLKAIAEKGTGYTTIVNLLELCGILSFNLNERQLLGLWLYFEDKYKVNVLPPARMESHFPLIGMQHLFDILKKGVSLGDALVLSVAGRHLPFALTMVTWDRDHFEEKFPGEVLTPEQYLRSV